MNDAIQFFVLPDLEKKNDEAIHDAINYFEKKCPYCNSLLFSGHVRSKIHIDHFIPISKGGQNVPWNILPVCQKCNSKKLAKFPKLFLSTEIMEICENYLKITERKYVGQVQIELEKYQQIKAALAKYNSDSEINGNKNEILNSVFEIVNGKTIVFVKPIINSNFDIEKAIEELVTKFFQIPNDSDEIEKYTTTELLLKIQPKVNFQIPRNLLSKTLKKMGFFFRLERVSAKESKKVFYVTSSKSN